MGMFDYVHLEAPLPDGTVTDAEFQTKSFDDPSMTHYTISADGRLFSDPDVFVPEEERRYFGTEKWGDEDSIWRLAGMYRRAPELREEIHGFHGDIEILDKDRRQFVARFTEGRLARIIDDTPASLLPPEEK